MLPYPGASSGKLSIYLAAFNYRLIRARCVIENWFSDLAARWRLSREPVRGDKENVTSFTSAGVILHNYFQQTVTASYC